MKSFMRHKDGATAVEFAIVAVPFFMFIFGLIGVSMYFFIMTSIEKGMDEASRLIRTGQSSQQNMTVAQFKDTICRGANAKSAAAKSSDGWIRCGRLEMFVSSWDDWSKVVTQPCVKNGKISGSTMGAGDPLANFAGGANAVVLVTACYRWTLPAQIPFLHLGNLSDGTMVLQTATAFQSEPP